jgi:ATP-binding cassette, subfamily G (WHITE), member 2, SNQ2
MHFPSLKVSETMGFANSTKAPGSKIDDTYVDKQTDKILASLGIAHTADTIVGNEFLWGVSGGEHKRVSVAKVMVTEVSHWGLAPYTLAVHWHHLEALVSCWDNSTRGLDASNALDFAKVLRRMADDENKTIVETLYQAGNGIFSQFDKVLVLAEGREVYYGPTLAAKAYFEDMGFRCASGANIGDFLTSVSVHTERQVLDGYEGTVPNTAEEFQNAYRQSPVFRAMMQEISSQSKDELAAEVAALNEMRNA